MSKTDALTTARGRCNRMKMDIVDSLHTHGDG